MSQFKAGPPKENSVGLMERRGGPILKVFSLFQLITGKKPNILNFEDRLKLQKISYLLQAAGLSLGYRFMWYYRGPYSPGLTADAYFARKSEPALLSSDDKDLGEKVHKFLVQAAGTEERPLELYASLLFLLKDEKLPKEDAIKKLISFKPWFSEEEARNAFAQLEKSKLFF